MWRMCLTKHASYKALAAAEKQAAEQQQRHNSAVDDIGSPEAGNINDLPMLAGMLLALTNPHPVPSSCQPLLPVG